MRQADHGGAKEKSGQPDEEIDEPDPFLWNEELIDPEHHHRRADQQPWASPADPGAPAVGDLAHERVGNHVGQPRQHENGADCRQADPEAAGVVGRDPDCQWVTDHRQRQAE